MTLSKEQFESLLEAAKPLMKWLVENTHPHCEAVVDQCSVKLLEGVATNRTLQFIPD